MSKLYSSNEINAESINSSNRNELDKNNQNKNGRLQKDVTNAFNAFDNPTADIDLNNFGDNLVIETSSSIELHSGIPFYDFDNYEYFAIDLIQKDLNGLRLSHNKSSSNTTPTKKNFLSSVAIANNLQNHHQQQEQQKISQQANLHVQPHNNSPILYDSMMFSSTGTIVPTNDIAPMPISSNIHLNENNESRSYIIYDEDILEND